MTTDDFPDLFEIDLQTIESAALRRLIEEIRNDAVDEMVASRDTRAPHGYNRIHNRHNRSVDHPSVPYNRTHNRHNRGR